MIDPHRSTYLPNNEDKLATPEIEQILIPAQIDFPVASTSYQSHWFGYPPFFHISV